MRFVLIVLSVAAIASGCSKKKNEKQAANGEPSAAGTDSTSEPSPAEQSREAKRKAYMDKKQQIRHRRVPMKITTDDVAGAIPKVDGGEAVGPPSVGPSGRVVIGELCLPGDDAAAAAAALEKSLQAEGWQNLNTRPARKGGGVGMSGQKPPLRLTAIVRGTSPRCEGKAGPNHAFLRYHKLLTKADAQKK